MSNICYYIKNSLLDQNFEPIRGLPLEQNKAGIQAALLPLPKFQDIGTAKTQIGERQQPNFCQCTHYYAKN